VVVVHGAAVLDGVFPGSAPQLRPAHPVHPEPTGQVLGVAPVAQRRGQVGVFAAGALGDPAGDVDPDQWR
jgi:hypothetical protein